jgi:hypothetical protein
MAEEARNNKRVAAAEAHAKAVNAATKKVDSCRRHLAICEKQEYQASETWTQLQGGDEDYNLSTFVRGHKTIKSPTIGDLTVLTENVRKAQISLKEAEQALTALQKPVTKPKVNTPRPNKKVVKKMLTPDINSLEDFPELY